MVQFKRCEWAALNRTNQAGQTVHTPSSTEDPSKWHTLHFRETLVSRPSFSVSMIICELHALACSAYCWHVSSNLFLLIYSFTHLLIVWWRQLKFWNQKLNKYELTILFLVKTQTGWGWYFKQYKFKKRFTNKLLVS